MSHGMPRAQEVQKAARQNQEALAIAACGKKGGYYRIRQKFKCLIRFKSTLTFAA